MRMREILNITDDLVERKMPLRFHAKWNPENMWYDIVDMNDNVVAKDVSPNPARAKELAAKYHPGMVIEREI